MPSRRTRAKLSAMTAQTAILLSGVMSGAISAALIDLNAFVGARQKDKSATFDIVLCIARIIAGALTGTGLGGATVMVTGL